MNNMKKTKKPKITTQGRYGLISEQNNNSNNLRKEHKTMQTIKITTKEYGNEETNTLFITKRGFSFTLESLQSANAEYFVTGYQCDENSNEYYIECYQSIPDARVKLFKFSAVVKTEDELKETGYDTFIEHLAENIQKLNILNNYTTCIVS